MFAIDFSLRNLITIFIPFLLLLINGFFAGLSLLKKKPRIFPLLPIIYNFIFTLILTAFFNIKNIFIIFTEDIAGRLVLILQALLYIALIPQFNRIMLIHNIDNKIFEPLINKVLNDNHLRFKKEDKGYKEGKGYIVNYFIENLNVKINSRYSEEFCFLRFEGKNGKKVREYFSSQLPILFEELILSPNFKSSTISLGRKIIFIMGLFFIISIFFIIEVMILLKLGK